MPFHKVNFNRQNRILAIAGASVQIVLNGETFFLEDHTNK
jgi:hypothetical protein